MESKFTTKEASNKVQRKSKYSLGSPKQICSISFIHHSSFDSSPADKQCKSVHICLLIYISKTIYKFSFIILNIILSIVKYNNLFQWLHISTFKMEAIKQNEIKSLHCSRTIKNSTQLASTSDPTINQELNFCWRRLPSTSMKFQSKSNHSLCNWSPPSFGIASWSICRYEWDQITRVNILSEKHRSLVHVPRYSAGVMSQCNEVTRDSL